MPIDLYFMEGSPPCRVVLLVAKYLGIDFNEKYIDYDKKEHMTPGFLKMNPQHCVPTMDDNGFYLWESRAIISYLVNQYAPDSDLYPKDPKKRAAIDKLLYFDIGVLYKCLTDAMYVPAFYGKEINPENEDTLKSSLKILEGLLSKSPYVAGDKLSLADFSIIITLSTIKLMAEFTGFDCSFLCHTRDWEKRVKDDVPFFQEINEAEENGMRSWISEHYKK